MAYIIQLSEDSISPSHHNHHHHHRPRSQSSSPSTLFSNRRHTRPKYTPYRKHARKQYLSLYDSDDVSSPESLSDPSTDEFDEFLNMMEVLMNEELDGCRGNSEQVDRTHRRTDVFGTGGGGAIFGDPSSSPSGHKNSSANRKEYDTSTTLLRDADEGMMVFEVDVGA
ncbi:hypothetical protein BCR33DRAFT_232508 [Rhizoclosmatium globosum]|uniref:Uncharacterized protein n=1 Tax=Rhizoclosmatium globosum TaxID=329046 RepID=A0A1Y2CAC2_9FUNG|nr:hypothetical protein BCR33DRAFT_232508 [Rhizoclosmatium globosum]|eukprot:ORY43983.1 hypothetical protein BCR33DRAFT_232508 [Rhizoclosmatium globosum]